MQTKKVQTVVFKIKDNQILCLCLKRSEEDGGFWHVLTGTLEAQEGWMECMHREIIEEVGTQNVLAVSPMIKEWVWSKKEEDILIRDYAVLVSDGKIVLNEEHTEFEWLPLSDALNRLEMESAKEMIELSKDFLSSYYGK